MLEILIYAYTGTHVGYFGTGLLINTYRKRTTTDEQEVRV